MAAPYRTAAQLLLEAGFGEAPRTALEFPEYPELNVQLQMLRKLDPRAPEGAWLEWQLARAREARVTGDFEREAQELAAARQVVVDAFARRAGPRWTPWILALVALLTAAGVLAYTLWQKRQTRRLEADADEVPVITTDDDAAEDVDADEAADEDTDADADEPELKPEPEPEARLVRRKKNAAPPAPEPEA